VATGLAGVPVPPRVDTLQRQAPTVSVVERVGVVGLGQMLRAQVANPNAAKMVVAGMLGVSAMAVQNALVQISLKGAPSTAVMKTNITRLPMDIGEVLLARDPDDVAKARSRAKHTWPAVVGFALGCGLGAASEAALGLRSLALPAGLALLALAMVLGPSWMTGSEPAVRIPFAPPVSPFGTFFSLCSPSAGPPQNADLRGYLSEPRAPARKPILGLFPSLPGRFL
jgi:hypothetical protein